MDVADVVQAGDLAVAVAARAIERQRPLVAGQRGVVAAQVQVREPDRVQVPGHVRPLAELLVEVERLLGLRDRRLVVAEGDGRVGDGGQGAGQRRPIARRAELGQQRAERALRFAVPAFTLERDGFVEAASRQGPAVRSSSRRRGGAARQVA